MSQFDLGKTTHDQLLATQIADEHWIWHWDITDRIVEITPPETLAAWREKDPLCSKYAWYNVLMYFAAARAEQLGYTKAIRRPRQKTCGLCKKRFSESSIPPSVVKHLGIDKLDVCINCIGDKFLQGTGSDILSKEGIIKYLQDLANLLQFVPPQNFGQALPA